MDLLEYDARVLFREAGIPVMTGTLVADVGELEGLDVRFPAVVKAQVLTGGRGKAGGIRFADNAAELRDAVEAILGMDIRGHIAETVMVVEKAAIARELYLSILLDRNAKKHRILFSPHGGMDIEQAAREEPDQIVTLDIDPLLGLDAACGRYLAGKAGLDKEQARRLTALLEALYALVKSHGCMLAEINPLAVLPNGNLLALDAKVSVDDSAVARLPALAAIRDAAPKPPLVREAGDYNFLYIPCEPEGDVVVMSNGSGMLMSCIDHLAKQGLTVSAVLDLGGGATADRIRHAVRILFATPGAEAMFINIFGGITRCDEVAAGIRAAVDEDGIDRPLVVRIEGTNKEAGQEILSGLTPVIPADELLDGVAAVATVLRGETA